MRRSILLTTAAVAAVFACPVLADEVDELGEVVITATRVPAFVSETPGARVIDDKTIQQRGAVFAADILADVPGLSVVRSGAFGGVAQVRMRGAAPGKTLVLIDGAPVNDAAEINGAYDFSGLELAEVERIEVLSGPQSSLWGSDAIGGVIAFTTREIDGLRAEVEAGSFGTLRHRLAGGVAHDRYAVGAFVSRFDTDGISAADERDGNPEKDGFENWTAGVKGRYAFSDAVAVDGSLRWSRGEADLDGYRADYSFGDTADTSETEQRAGVVRLTTGLAGLQHRFSLSASNIDRAIQSAYPSRFEADRQVWRWQADGQALDERLAYAFGAEREDTSGSLSTGESEELGTSSVFGVAHWRASGRLTVTAALRWDDTDDFGSKTTGRASAALDLGAGFTLSGAYGAGFKAPSISQAVCDFCYSADPYPALRPETADSAELAVGWRAADGRLEGRATVYRLSIEDQIFYLYDPDTYESVYVNLDKTRTDGVELEGRAVLGGGFDLNLAYAWTDAVDRATGRRLLRNPEHSGSATLGWTGERLSGALTVRAEDDQDDAGGVREGFVTANLNAAYALTPNVDLTARIENLADARYQQVLFYGEPGRSGYVGIRLRY